MFTISKRAGFLKAITEQPADDTVRLVFSDWLREQDCQTDEHWGEFIWHQIHNRKLPWYLERFVDKMFLWQCDGTGRWIYNVTRPANDCYVWDICEAGIWTKLRGCQLGYSRGFVSTINCQTQAFVDNATVIGASYPLEKVTTEKIPMTEAIVMSTSYWLFNAGPIFKRNDNENVLTQEVFSELTDGQLLLFTDGQQYARKYYSREQVDSDLSRAFINFAKKKGLEYGVR